METMETQETIKRIDWKNDAARAYIAEQEHREAKSKQANAANAQYFANTLSKLLGVPVAPQSAESITLEGVTFVRRRKFLAYSGSEEVICIEDHCPVCNGTIYSVELRTLADVGRALRTRPDCPNCKKAHEPQPEPTAADTLYGLLEDMIRDIVGEVAR